MSHSFCDDDVGPLTAPSAPKPTHRTDASRMGRVVAPTRATLCAAGIIAFAVALRLLLNALGWPPDDGDEGAMGILRWHSRDEHSFEVVTASWLNEYSAYTWRYV